MDLVTLQDGFRGNSEAARWPASSASFPIMAAALLPGACAGQASSLCRSSYSSLLHHACAECAVPVQVKLVACCTIPVQSALCLCYRCPMRDCFPPTCQRLLLGKVLGLHAHAHARTHTHTHTHTHSQTDMHTCVHVRMHIHAFARAHTHILTQTSPCNFACPHMQLLDHIEASANGLQEEFCVPPLCLPGLDAWGGCECACPPPTRSALDAWGECECVCLPLAQCTELRAWLAQHRPCLTQHRPWLTQHRP